MSSVIHTTMSSLDRPPVYLQVAVRISRSDIKCQMDRDDPCEIFKINLIWHSLHCNENDPPEIKHFGGSNLAVLSTALQRSF